MVSTQSDIVRDEIAKNLQSYIGGGPTKKCDKEALPRGTHPIAALHSPSNSETSSLFSTVDCSSFSSRSDASSLVKEEASPIISVSVCSSVGFGPGSNPGESEASSSYFEFSFVEGKLVGDDQDNVGIDRKLETDSNKPAPAEAAVSLPDDAYETFPVWTDRTRYCSKEIHSCINPCFDQVGSDGGELRVRTSRRKKLAKSLGSVLSKHLPLSPGPTFRRSSYDKFKSRLSLGHLSPLSERISVATPSRAFDAPEEKSGYSSSRGAVRRRPATSPYRLSFARPGGKMDSKIGEFSASTRGKNSIYGTSPMRQEKAKALGCLGVAKAVFPSDSASVDGYKGPVYFASEESVHGGKTRCLPSPRLSFGKATTPKEENPNAQQLASASMAMAVPSRIVQGHLHCVIRNDSPNFSFFVDGVEEVLVAKAIRSCPLDGLESGELVYMFYSWKSKGRSRAHWKTWGRRDRSSNPELVGSMTLTSKIVPAESKDGDDAVELEFVLSDGSGSCSPRLSFSTWETGTSPQSSSKSPFRYPSPFSAGTPSPVRIANAAASRYVAMSMVPATASSPRSTRADSCLRGSKKSSLSSSPLRPKSDDDRSTFQDAWSDSEDAAAEGKIHPREFAAIVIRVPAGEQSVWETLNRKWYMKSLRNSKRSSGVRRFSLPGRFQQETKETKETKENLDDNKSCKTRTHSFKLRELMGVKPDFGREEPPASKVTVILPAGKHGLPLHGTGGPQPLLERWRSGGRCDCGSWDLGCGLTILEDEQDQIRRSKEVVKLSLQGKDQGQHMPPMRLGAISDGLFPISFQAPMSYLQAFASAIAALYARGPVVLDGEETIKKLERPPRIPLMPLSGGGGGGQQRRHIAYCSPPPASLLDRL